jgi:hypothetical protein
MADELARRIKGGAISIISSVSGFLGYYVVYAPNDTVTGPKRTPHQGISQTLELAR